MSNDLIGLSEAVHNRLSTDIYLTTMIGTPPRLYDQAPEDPVYPYVTYGDLRAEDISGDAAALMQAGLTLHVWSRYAGRAETLKILSAMSGALMREPIELANGGEVRVYIQLTDIVPTPDRLGYHGLLRLRCVAQMALLS